MKHHKTFFTIHLCSSYGLVITDIIYNPLNGSYIASYRIDRVLRKLIEKELDSLVVKWLNKYAA